MLRRPLFRALATLFLAGCIVTGCGRKTESAASPGAATPKPPADLRAVIETDKGEIEIAFYTEESPQAVENFRLLAERGYYNGLTFHRIVKGFMLQGGDPKGDGTGGESAWGGKFEDNIVRESPLYRRNYMRGVVAMANSGPNTNTSQFFIMHKDYPLPPAYVIFGHVVRGLEVVDALAETPTKAGPMGEKSVPVTPVVMKKVTILHKPNG